MKEMWDQRYSGEEYVYGTQPNLFFKEKIMQLPPAKLFLPAEGEGRNAVFAAGLGWQVAAMDYSEQAKIKALRLAEAQSVVIDYTVGDFTLMEFEKEHFDAIGLIYAHIDPRFRKKVHQGLVKSLRPGGYFILEAFNKKQLMNSSGGPKSVEMLYSIPMLKNDFEELEIILLEEVSERLDQGGYHQGEAAIIRLFGRKN
jgi:SAM-dependent methyltransferase